MMNVLSIVPESVVDGPGVRMVIFLAGCPHRCMGCHNPQSWKIGGGEPIALERLKEIIAASPWDGVTFSGGEPFLQDDGLAELVTFSKAVGKNVWVYSGYTYEQLCRFGEAVQTVLDSADVLVDGPYVQAERDLSLRFRGSRNQRIIELRDIRRSVKASHHQTRTK